MGKLSEIEAIRAIDEALSALEDSVAKSRVLRWAFEKHSTGSMGGLSSAHSMPSSPIAPTTPKPSKTKASQKHKAKIGIGFVKDLNLKPRDNKSFNEFIKEKNPQSQLEQCVAAVYYLKNILGLSNVSHDHVYTCFKAIGWRLPADLANAMQLVSSRKGWLDTRESEDVKITTLGENLIDHDLPRKKA